MKKLIAPKKVCLSTEVLFGKYYGQTLYKLIKKDVLYVDWLLKDPYKECLVDGKVKLMLDNRHLTLHKSGYITANTYSRIKAWIGQLPTG